MSKTKKNSEKNIKQKGEDSRYEQYREPLEEKEKSKNITKYERGVLIILRKLEEKRTPENLRSLMEYHKRQTKNRISSEKTSIEKEKLISLLENHRLRYNTIAKQVQEFSLKLEQLVKQREHTLSQIQLLEHLLNNN
jgi:queuine/archaeosine tRNA-ribosyltransferase